MEIITALQYNEFEQFMSTHINGGFTQSLSWAKVKNNWEFRGIVSRGSDGFIQGALLILIIKKPKYNTAMMYSPRGPVCDYNNKAVLKDLTDGAVAVAKEYNAYIFITDPCIETHQQELIDNFVNLGYRFTPNKSFHDTIQPRFNYMMRHFQGMTEEELFMKIGRKSRYCVKYALKNGVEVKIGDAKTGLDDFYSLYSLTGDRKEFSIRPKEYLSRMLIAYGENARLYMSYYNGIPVSGAIAVQYAGKVSYVYGASSNEHRDLNSTYLLQWEMIKWALQSNCTVYDFLGIVLTPEENEKLYGVYLFKQSFKSGEAVEFAGEFNLIFDEKLYKEIDG